MAGGAARQAEFDLLEAFWRRHGGGTTDRANHSFDPIEPNIAEGGQFDDCPELRCIADRLAPEVLAAAASRALDLGVGADRVLIASGAIDEETYARALAKSLDIAFEIFAWTPRTQCPLDDAQFVDAVSAGIVPLRVGHELVYVIAPRGVAARRLTELAVRNPFWRERIRFTTTAHLRRFAERYCGDAIGHRATNLLSSTIPQMSAAPPRQRTFAWRLALAASVVLAAFAVSPRASMMVLQTLLTTMFIAWIVLRLVGVLMHRPRQERKETIPDRALPVYTIMIPLYREASSVDGLIAAIRNLDYPPEKLDVKFIIEPDDEEMRVALARARHTAPFEIIVAPAVGPRTKPKALNAALPFAQGSFLVIFDAEDRPEPDQLRCALDAFRRGDHSLACVQASLTIDNTGDNWLSALFTAEYAGQFDVFLPALAALKLPLPLGGSSNHFRGIR